MIAPPDEELPDEQWVLDFVTESGPSGFVRLARVGDRCWYWCYLVGDSIGLVAVRDHDVARPRRADVLEVRADALWAELVCETPDEHWGAALEAFGIRLDAAPDAWPVDEKGEIGERLPVGLDLEWEVEQPPGPPFGTVRGEVLLGRERFDVDGWGALVHRVAPETAWPRHWSGWIRSDDGSFETVTSGTTDGELEGIGVPGVMSRDDGSQLVCEPRAVVPVPLGVAPVPAGRAEERGPALVRVLTATTSGGMTGIGWVEMLQSSASPRSEER